MTFAVPPRVIATIVGLAFVVIGSVWHFSGDRATAKRLVEVQTELTKSQEKVKTLEGQLISVTEKKDEFETRLKASDEERLKVLKELDEKLNSITKSPAPADCKGAVNWVRKNKGLL